MQVALVSLRVVEQVDVVVTIETGRYLVSIATRYRTIIL
jgi:hypothetical protein